MAVRKKQLMFLGLMLIALAGVIVMFLTKNSTKLTAPEEQKSSSSSSEEVVWNYADLPVGWIGKTYNLGVKEAMDSNVVAQLFLQIPNSWNMAATKWTEEIHYTENDVPV